MGDLINFEKFDANVLVQLKTYEFLKKGSYLQKSEGIENVVYRNSKPYILNKGYFSIPAEKTSIFKKIDPIDYNKYEVFFISTIPFSLSSGTNTITPDPKANNAHVKYGIQWQMTLKITGPRIFEGVIVKNGEQYTKNDFKNQFEQSLNNFIKSKYSEEFSYSTPIEAQKNITSINLRLKGELNKFFEEYGVEVLNFAADFVSDAIHDEMIYQMDMEEEKIKRISKYKND